MEDQGSPKKPWYKRAKFIVPIAFLALIGVAVASPGSSRNTAKPAQVNSGPTVETKTVTEKQTIAFETQTVNDATLEQGQTSVKQEGKNGEKTLVFQVTLTDGKETARTKISETISTQPTPKIITNGTKVATAPVSPAVTSPPPTTASNPYSNATALCVDGTYSYSAHASGTCSHHGGVAQWINHPAS